MSLFKEGELEKIADEADKKTDEALKDKEKEIIKKEEVKKWK